MKNRAEIVFSNMGRSEFMEESVRENIDYIERYVPNVSKFYVAISAPHKSNRKGNQYAVHIRARLPGTEFAVSHHPGSDNGHSDMQVLLSSAFSAFKSQLQKHKSKREYRRHTALHSCSSEIWGKIGSEYRGT